MSVRRVPWAIVSLLCFGSSVAFAIPVQWTFQDAVFDDGGTATGSFIYDADTNAYSAISFTTTLGSKGISNAYTDANFNSGGNDSLFLASTLPLATLGWGNFQLDLATSMTNAGGTVPIASVFGMQEQECFDAQCSDLRSRQSVSGSVVGQVIPIPAAAWLFGSALGLLGWMRARKS